MEIERKHCSIDCHVFLKSNISFHFSLIVFETIFKYPIVINTNCCFKIEKRDKSLKECMSGYYAEKNWARS